MAARVIVSLEDVHLSFGGKPLFEGLTLHVMEGDKICLLGRNGAGKTTLMRLLVEELELDKGSRYAMPGLTTGYLAQKFDFDSQQTVKEFVLAGLPAGKTADLHAYEADMVIEPLGLDAAWMMGNLSGGQLRRAALARALVSEPDILLLDEPTNHLDLNTIEWLEKRLASYRGAVVCVSHDRAFLEAFSSRVFWLSDGIIRICPKGYAAFEAWAEEILEQEARAIQNMEKKFEAEIDWTQGGVTGRRKRNQRRLANLEKLREKLKNDKAVYQQKFRKLSMDPLETVAASKIMAEFRGTSKKFAADDGDKIILDNFELTILRGDRIGILGRNGSGKSTFLKLLLGHEQPDQGTVFRSKTMEPSYFDQNRALLNPRKTLWETLCPQGGDQVSIGSGENSRTRHVCGYLKDFLFDPKIARDQVATLSGGQQNRLMLAKTLANPGNLLILDEPTNDLDMDTLDMLQELLADYNGTLILVSHDRDFLDRTVTEVLAFEGDGIIHNHIGGYTDYLAARKTIERDEKKKAAQQNVGNDNHFQTIIQPPKKPEKMSFKLRYELEQLPQKIGQRELEIENLKKQLADPAFYSKNPTDFAEKSQRLGEAMIELDGLETRWLELSEMAAQEVASK